MRGGWAFIGSRMSPEDQPTIFTQPPDGSRPASGGWQAPGVEEMQARLPNYEVLELLGRGGMGAVYKALQKSLRRLVAIKVLARESVQDDLKFAERFQHEAMAMARLSHPGIVNVHDAGEAADGLLYFVMEHVEGRDLAHEIAERGRLPEAEVRKMATQIVEALGYAHANGIVHRDIKPANILLDAQGWVKVADFGLAKASEPLVSTLLTKSGTSMGTADFMAPETRKSGMADARSDLFSLGVTLYQMLTGELPQGMFKLPSELHPELDARWDEIICKALEPRPQDRYQSTEELKRDLATIDTDRPRAAKISSTPKRRWRLAAAWVGVALVAGLSWPFLRPQTTVEQRGNFDLEAFRQQMAAADVETQWALLKAKLDELNGSDVTILRKDEDKQRGRITYLGINHKSRQIKDIRPIAAISGYFELAFHDLWLEDISCLKGMRIGRLGIFQSNFTDLSVLSTLPSLTALNLANARGIKDFTPLGRLKLQVLDLNTNPQLKDIAFVRGMPLTHLNILGTSVKDLSPLAGMELKELECDNDVPISAELLRSLPKLELINRKPVNVLRPAPGEKVPFDLAEFTRQMTAADVETQWALLKAKLDELNGSDVAILRRDEDKQRGRITYLGISNNGKELKDITPVAALTGVVSLFFHDVWLRDISCLKGMKLEQLGIFQSQLTDLSPLETMPVLWSLNLPNAKGIQDFSGLKKLPLGLLTLNTTPHLKDIAFVREMPQLRVLNIRDTGVKDLSPLAGTGIEELDCNADIPITAELLRSLPKLKKLNGRPVEEWWQKTGAAPASSPAGNVIELMPLIDLKRDVVAGIWTREGNDIQTAGDGKVPGGGSPRLQLPFQPPEEYDFEIEFTPQTDSREIVQILSGYGRQFLWVVNMPNNAGMKAGFDTISGLRMNDRKDGTLMRDRILKAGSRHRSKVEVRKTGLRGYVDDELLVEWGTSPASYQHLDLVPHMSLRESLRLGIGVSPSVPLHIHRITVRKVTGE